MSQEIVTMPENQPRDLQKEILSRGRKLAKNEPPKDLAPPTKLDEDTIELEPGEGLASERYHLETMRQNEERVFKFLEDAGFKKLDRVRYLHKAMSNPKTPELSREVIGGHGEAISTSSRIEIQMPARSASETMAAADGEVGFAFEKTMAGQLAMTKNGQQTWLDPVTGKRAFGPPPAFLDENSIAGLRALADPRFGEAVRQTAARAYGMDVDDLHVPEEQGYAGYMPGVDPEAGVPRERFAWVADMIFFANVVPVTVCRPTKEDHQLVSWQRGAHSVDKKFPAREFGDAELLALWESPPEEWLSKMDPSIVARLDTPEKKEKWLRNVTRGLVMSALLDDVVLDAADGKDGNMLFDPLTGRFFKIDGALSVPLLTHEMSFPTPVALPPGKKAGETCRQLRRSFSLEIVIKHGLKLDAQAHHYLETVLEDLSVPGTELYEIMKTEFQLLFPQQQIVRAKMARMVNRLHDWVSNGTPRELTPGEDMPQIFAYHMLLAAQARASAQSQAA